MYIYLTYLLTFGLSSLYCYIDDNLKYDKNFSLELKKKQYEDILPLVTVNSFFFIPLLCIPYETILISNFNLYYSILTLFISFILIDPLFWICHRIMHIPILYKWSHKIHHKYKKSVGMEALYLHWFDLYFGNIIPLYLPMMLFNLDLYSHILWTVIIVSNTVLVHGNKIENYHSDHHLYFKFNYGSAIYTDKVMDTVYELKRDKINTMVGQDEKNIINLNKNRISLEETRKKETRKKETSKCAEVYQCYA